MAAPSVTPVLILITSPGRAARLSGAGKPSDESGLSGIQRADELGVTHGLQQRVSGPETVAPVREAARPEQAISDPVRLAVQLRQVQRRPVRGVADHCIDTVAVQRVT